MTDRFRQPAVIHVGFFVCQAPANDTSGGIACGMY